MEVSIHPFPLFLKLLINPRIVNDIRQKNSGIVFRRTPTVGDALIYILYEGDYQAMGKDGVQIPPPANSLSPQKPSMLFDTTIL